MTINNKQHEQKKETSPASLTVDALSSEIQRLRQLKQSCGKLSRSNERKLKKYKKLFQQRTGTSQDGRFFELIFNIFDFEVSHETVRRYYYMSDDSREFGK